ncbi:MAG: hypothetical protein H6712_23605 [Myxococcales bacterium]|nr:hypothetical protein [Myxococcales bacterium]MCB9716864.1 hypothetical protein [Myxococcales bacterium]
MRPTLPKLAFLSLSLAGVGLGVWLSGSRAAQAGTSCTGGIRACNEFISACEHGGGAITPGSFHEGTGIPTRFTCRAG